MAIKRYPLAGTVSINRGAPGRSRNARRSLRMAVLIELSVSTKTFITPDPRTDLFARHELPSPFNQKTKKVQRDALQSARHGLCGATGRHRCRARIPANSDSFGHMSIFPGNP